MTIVDIIGDIQPSKVQNLIDFCSEHAAFYVFIQWAEGKLGNQSLAFLRSLKTSIIEQKLANTWPGTISTGDTVTVYTGRIDKDSKIQLVNYFRNLYEACEEDAFEDLSFLDQEKKEVFVSITHEKCAYFMTETTEGYETIARFLEGNQLQYSTWETE